MVLPNSPNGVNAAAAISPNELNAPEISAPVVFAVFAATLMPVVKLAVSAVKLTIRLPRMLKT